MRVLLPLPLPPFNFLPPHGEAEVKPGCRVVVPWQNGVRIGVVVGAEPLRGAAALELREVIATLGTEPFLSAAGLALIGRVAQHTCSPAGTVLANLLPTGLNEPLLHEVRALAEVEAVPSERWTDAARVPPRELDLLRRQGLLEERVRPQVKQVQVLEPRRRADDALSGKPQANQRRALSALWRLEHAESAAALSRDADVPESAVRALVKKGYAAYAHVDAPPPALPSYFATEVPEEVRGEVALPEGHFSLSGGLRRDRVRVLLPLLHENLRRGESVLVLVPEGAYLEETAALLAAHVPLQVLSGELSDAQRSRLWSELRAGEPVVLVGSYLALLAPLEPLGRVVVLEEGSTSYKLAQGCRVFVPTAARLLAEAAGATLVLADALATPEAHRYLGRGGHEQGGLENGARDGHAARRGVVTLPTPPARVHTVDLTQGQSWPLSTDLIKVLKQVEARERQAVLLAPRRGFSAALRCAECDWLAGCPNCDLPLRYHRERYVLRCHQCGHAEKAPALCPSCDSPDMSPTRAAGTQWVVSAVQKLLPDIPVLRFDSDKREDLSALYEGQPGVLVTTSAILRRAPLPNLSLIAVTLLDTLLNLSDFRAEEGAYRLLLNLAELAPGKRPLTLVQTFQPEHAAVRAYAQGHTESFLDALLERRERFGYPPYRTLAKVQLSAKQQSEAERAATWLAGAVRTAGAAEEELLGPTPAPVARVKNQYSYQLFVRTASAQALRERLQPALNYRGSARLRIDVDPREIAGFLE